jgi:hypothetical protein
LVGGIAVAVLALAIVGSGAGPLKTGQLSAGMQAK